MKWFLIFFFVFIVGLPANTKPYDTCMDECLKKYMFCLEKCIGRADDIECGFKCMVSRLKCEDFCEFKRKDHNTPPDKPGSKADIFGNKAGTFKDPKTGLMWQTGHVDFPLKKWSEAVIYCMDLTLAGYSDWRLPNIDELRTLIIGCPNTMPKGICPVKDGFRMVFPDDPVDLVKCNNLYQGKCVKSSDIRKNCGGCKYKQGPGPEGDYMDGVFEGTSGAYWSSSSDMSDTNYAFYIAFDDGRLDTYGKDKYNVLDVRCVRK